MPNLFPLSFIPIYAATEAFAYVKFVASNNGGAGFFRYFAAFLAINFVLWAFFWGWLHARFISPLRKFPFTGVRARDSIVTRTKMTRPPGSNFLDWMANTENEGIIRAPFPMVNSILLTSPETLAEVLVHHPYDYTKPAGGRGILRLPLGDGLIIVEGDVHKFQRKHLMPSFGFRNVKQLYPMMWKKSIMLMDQIRAEIQDQFSGEKETGRVEINTWASKATMDIIGVAAIGTEFDAMRDPNLQILKDYEVLLTPNSARIFHFFLAVTFGWFWASKIPMKTNTEFHSLAESMHSISARLVKEKRAAMDQGGDHFDILGLLIKSNDFSDKELADQVLTFLGAGHETTSSAFTWACYLLSTRPEYQQRLREEVRENLPADFATNTSDLASILEKLPLLNAICQETLRLYPTVPITVRTAIRDSNILGTRIPKGTNTLMSPWAINRSPTHWGPTADQFIPERWITDGKPNNNGGAASNYCILTFLHGPRSCIGQGFAKAELRCLLAAIVLNFEWTLDMPVADVMPAGIITIKPKNGMYLKMRKIEQ